MNTKSTLDRMEKKFDNHKEAENMIILNKQDMINYIQQYDKEKLSQTINSENKEILVERLEKIKLQNKILEDHLKNLQINNKNNNPDNIYQDYSKYNRKDLTKIVENSLNTIIEEKDNKYLEEKNNYFEINSNINELYSNSNFLIIQVKFHTYVHDLNKTINIKCSLNFKIKDILNQACIYWKLDNKKYILYDDKLSFIDENIELKEIFLSNFGKNKYSFNLKLKNQNSCELVKNQIKSNLNPFKKNAKQINNEVVLEKFNTKNDTNMIDLFFKKYPQLENYIEIDYSLKFQEKEVNNNEYKFNFYSQKGPIYFYIIVIIFVMYTIILSNFDIKNNYNIVSSLSSILRITKYLDHSEKKTIKDSTFITYEEIRSPNDFYDWIDLISAQIFDKEKNFFLQNIILVGDIRLIQMKTKTYSCGENTICNYIQYNENTKFKEDIKINGTTTGWGKYMTAKELKNDFNIKGFNTEYDGSGYLFSLGNNNSTYEEVETRLESIRENNYLDEKTSLINFIFSGYIIDKNYFFSVNLALERLGSGYKSAVSDINIFWPTFYWNNKAILVLEIIVNILSFFVMLMNIKTIYSKRKKENVFIQLFSFEQIFLVLYNIMFIYYLITIIIYYSNYNSNILFSNEKLIDTRNFSHYYKLIFRIIGFKYGLSMAIFFIFLTLKITKKDNINIIRYTIKENIVYLVLLVPIIIGLGYMGFYVLGIYNEDFNNVQSSLISVIMITLGRLELGKIIQYKSSIGLILYLIYYFAILILTFTIYFSFGIKMYYRIIRKKGYYSSIWRELSVKEYLNFFLFFLPKNILSNIEEKKKFNDKKELDENLKNKKIK